MKKYFIIIALFGLFGLQNTYSQKQVPKNVIIMISDGCGINHIRATNLYQYGKLKAQKYEDFPVQLFVSTYPAIADDNDVFAPAVPYASCEAWKNFDYVKNNVTCSSAAGTAISTGVKTQNGFLGVDVNKKKLTNLSELAKTKKKSAGVVTSVQWSHATPAAFAAHNESRDNYSEIAKEMVINSQLDVIMGCGHPYFDNNGEKLKAAKSYKYVGDSLTFYTLKSGSTEYLLNGKQVKVNDCDFDGKSDAWHFIESKSDFEKLTAGETPNRVLATAQVSKTLQQERGLNNDNYLKANKITEEDPKELMKNKIQSVPDLKTMALGAINILDENKNGFFLMIEGGAVDWAAHSNQTGRMLVEEIDFNKAVDAVINWVEKNSSWEETLLVITADHETGYITPPLKEDDDWSRDLEITPAGMLPKIQWNSTHHTNSLVPLYAKGAGAKYFSIFADHTDLVRGKYINNSEIAQMIFMLWGE